MGVESGSPRMLKKLRKGITPEQVITAAEHGKETPIYFSYDFMVDLPGETVEDLRMTFDLIYKLLPIKKNSIVSAIRTYVAYPGTSLSAEAEEKLGYKIEDRFTFEQFGQMSLKEYNNLLNPRRGDMSRECIFYYYRRLNAPFKFRLNLKSIYSDAFRIIGLIRRRLRFYRLPLELYLVHWLKSVANRFKGIGKVSGKANAGMEVGR